MSILSQLMILIISFVIGIVFCRGINIDIPKTDDYMAPTVIITVIYFTIIYFFKYQENRQDDFSNVVNIYEKQLDEINTLESDNVLNNTTEMSGSVKAGCSLSNLYDTSIGPLDNLTSSDIDHKLKSLFDLTKSSDNAVNYQNDKSHNDIVIETDNSSLSSSDNKYLEIAKRDYPELTKNQINYQDCTNHSDDKSCSQIYPNPYPYGMIDKESSILVEGISNNENLTQISHEDLGFQFS
jgi:hypothetical protein